MAVQTIYILTAAAVTPNWYGRTQLNGTAPSQTNTAYGWTPGKIAVTTPYYRGRLGASTNATVAQAASWNASTSGPTPGTGATATTAGDSYVAGPFSGVFAATVWTFNWNLRASAAGCVGNINMRVWKSANADGSAATQLMANTAGAVVTLSTTLATNSQITWSPGALTLNNEYLFFQLEWQETVAGTSNTNTVAFLAGQTLITTPDLATGITGTLAITQAAQTVSAAGNSVVRGALSLTELSDTLAAAGAPRVDGALTLTELSDALAATGAVLVPLTATLSITETPDTVAAAGGPVVSGFVGGGAPWTPANLGANLSAWFDASDVATITVAGSGVSQWLDKSSYSRHVIQPNDAQRPAYSTGRVGLLDNTALYCSGPQFPTGNHDYVFAGKAIGAAKYHTLLLSGGGQHINFITDLSDNCGVWVSSFFQVGGLNWPPGTDALIYGSISNTSTAAMAKNGGALTTASVGTFDCTLLTLGQASYPQGFGDLYEFIMLPYATATDIRQRLEGYVAWKWNLASLLPVDHPYKTFAPSTVGGALPQADQTVAATGTVVTPPINGSLSVTETSDTITATGAVTVRGALSVPQSNQTVVAAGATLVGGTLSVTETTDAVASSGGPVVGGILGGGSDPSTVLLLHCDGSDGSTVFTDATGLHGTATVVGPAKVATADSVFGGASLLLDGVSAALRFADSPDFTLTGDFTIDLRFNSTAAAAARNIAGQCSSANSNIAFFIRLASTNNVVAAVSANGLAANLTSITGTTAFSTIPTGWHHLALVRSGNVLKLFLDGVQEGGDVAFTGPVFDSPNNLAIGAQGERTATPFPGYIDEFRISSVARWTANFTPPAAAYSVSAGGITQAAQTLAATGTVADSGIAGSLSVTEAPDTVAATGAVAVRGTLSVSQAAQTIVAAGGPRVGGTLTAQQASQTVVAAGAPRVGGTLTAQQAAHTLAAGGWLSSGGTLVVTQAPQTIAAAAGVTVTGRLSGVIPAVTYFDPATTYTATIVLSNNNLTVTRIGSPSYDNTISTTTLGATKVYTEIHLNQHTNDGRNAIGIALKTAPIHLSWLGDTALAYGWFGDANLYHSGTTVAGGTMPTYATGHWVGIAVDRVAKTVQFRNITTASAWSTAYSIADFGNNDVGVAATLQATTQSITANFNGTWLGAPPSVDYTSWSTPIVSDGITQAPQTLAGAGSVVSGVAGSLTVTQAAQTLAGAGTVRVSGTLTRTEAGDTLAAAGGPRVVGALARPQADQTIVAAAGPRVSAVLALIQASQIVAATGAVQVVGALTARQADHTFSAYGISGSAQVRVMVLA